MRLNDSDDENDENDDDPIANAVGIFRNVSVWFLLRFPGRWPPA